MALHIQEYGDRSADCLMIFLHGGGVSGWMWEKQVKAFARYHCAVPDLPGHGLSSDAPEFSIRSSAAELLQWIEDHAGGKKVVVIGFSLGAQVLTQMLGMQPALIDYAIINSALVRPVSYAARWIRPAARLSFPLIQYRWFSRLQAKTLYLGDEYLERYYEESCRMQPETLITVLEENMSFSIPPGFSEAAGKILVTVGEQEKAVMKQSAQDLVDASSHCIGVMIPGVGHGVSLARPELFNGLVDAWIHDRDLPGGYIRMAADRPRK
ncbi:alpha/beta hydrolase [Paenibacillus tritici]|uniref:Alpha/beta hydrolase n=1 Tax=Paenibacillus tritici TaxID=1873425 RepID=A0ABX2DJE3_9BACL|nr:alpha/beta hydrolase [Paenibacillus tritici]NQX44615.1 alpha/beta hydrolase [Paenibacillus tritici]QUL53679.1 alpha/beta hydrolase [Paenibacillus tritici]